MLLKPPVIDLERVNAEETIVSATWNPGTQGAFDDAANWAGGAVPTDGETAVIASPTGDQPIGSDTLFAGGTTTSEVVFGPLPTPVDTDTVYFDTPGQYQVINGTTYYFQGVAYSFTFPVPVVPPDQSGDAIAGTTIDFGNGDASLTAAILENTTLGDASVVNINGPSLWKDYFDNTLAGTIDIGASFSIDGTAVPQPTANDHGSTSELDMYLSGDGSVQNNAQGTLAFSAYLPTTDNTGTINIASGSELRLNYDTGAEDAGESTDGTIRFLTFPGDADFQNSGTINVTPGSGLLIYEGGNNDGFLLSSFTNNGQVLIQGGQGVTTGAVIQAALSGSGTITVDGGNATDGSATYLQLNAIIDSNITVRNATVLATDTGSDGANYDGDGQHRAIGGTLNFADGNGTLIIDPTTNSLFAGFVPALASVLGAAYDTPSLDFWNMPIEGFRAGDTIIANIYDSGLGDYNYAIAPLLWDAATDTLSIEQVATSAFFPSQAGTVTTVAQFTLDGPYSLSNLFETVTPGDSGYNLQVAITTDAPACFVADTHIATPAGPVRVQDLLVGDLVVTSHHAGGRHANSAKPVVWLGECHVDCRRHPTPKQVWPVRVCAGTFGPGRPERDLWLSPDHAIFSDDVLIPVKHLINGTTIVQEPRDKVTYFHVELARHEVIFAEGLPCESYLDTGNRGSFDNCRGKSQRDAAYGEALWEAAACAPLRLGRDPPAGAVGESDLSALLWPDWYLATYPDVRASGMSPDTHYRHWGRAEGRRPCPEIALLRGLGLIDPATLVFTMADVVSAGIDPVEHFCSTGWREQRRPNPYFDTAWYLERHDVPAGMNPLLHYVLSGENQGLPPGPHFDCGWYRRRYTLPPAISPLAHYLRHRRTQAFGPNPGFDVATYVKLNASTLRPGRDPYAHYLSLGHAEVEPARHEQPHSLWVGWQPHSNCVSDNRCVLHGGASQRQ